MESEEQLGDLAIADVVAGATGAVTAGLSEPGRADADGPAEDHVLVGPEPVQAEEVTHAGTIVVHRRVPHELLVDHGLFEAGGLDAPDQALAVAAIDLVLEQEFEELQRGEFGLARVGGAVGQRGQQAAQAQALEATNQIRGDLHGAPPSWGDGRSSRALARSAPAASERRRASVGPGSRSSAGSTTKPRNCAYSRNTRSIPGA